MSPSSYKLGSSTDDPVFRLQTVELETLLEKSAKYTYYYSVNEAVFFCPTPGPLISLPS